MPLQLGGGVPSGILSHRLVVYAAADWWLSTVRPAPLWLFSEFGVVYKYSDLLTYLPFGILKNLE